MQNQMFQTLKGFIIKKKCVPAPLGSHEVDIMPLQAVELSSVQVTDPHHAGGRSIVN